MRTTKNKHWIIGLLALTIGVSAFAATIEKQVHTALRYMNMEQVYDELEQSIDIALSEMEGQLPRESYLLLRKGIRKGFAIDDLNSDLESHLIQGYHEANYQKLISVWESGFGQIVYDDRRQLNERWMIFDILTLQRSPEARLLNYAEKLKENPPSQQRIDLIRKLLVSTVDLELNMAVRRELTRAVLLSAAQTSQDGANAQSSIERHLEQMHEQWLEESASVIVLSYFYIYRHHSDRELQQVVYFYQQPTMQWFQEQLKKAFSLALEKAGRRSAGYIKSRNQT
jgi:hypothetical protein